MSYGDIDGVWSEIARERAELEAAAARAEAIEATRALEKLQRETADIRRLIAVEVKTQMAKEAAVRYYPRRRKQTRAS